jgi:hypothetical protein
MRVRTIFTVAAALCGVSTAALLATVSTASAVGVTEAWYLGSSPTGTPITSYNFGSVLDGSNPSVYLTLALDPGNEIGGYTNPSLLSPFAVGTVTSNSACGTGGTSFCITVQTFFDPLSPGPYTQVLDVPFTVTGVDPDALLTLNGTGVSAVPLPAALPLFATGLGALGLLGWRRKRKAAALAA